MRSTGQRIRPALLHLLAASAGLLFCTIPAGAQAFTARLSIISLVPEAMVRVEGTYSSGATAWSFRNTYGNVIGLGERIQALTLADSNGAGIQVRRLSPGEFRAERLATHFSYEVRLAELADPGDAAHISSLGQECGYLMLADLLPTLAGSRLRVEFKLPEQWSCVAPSSAREAGGGFEVSDPASAVFFLGRELRKETRRVGATEFTFVRSGDWPFSGADLAKLAGRIVNDHSKHVGFDLKGQAVLMLAPFPGSVGAERWSAETRRSSVVMLLGRNASREALLGQLSVVLSHELFHLWVPNALSLDGEYDWFFEGFTLYQALRAAVRLGFVSFQEYLNTLARVYDSYLATAERDRFSLIEASARRWTAAPSLVYDKGMLIAFLYDLRLRKASHSRRSLDDVYHELFRGFPPGASRADGNKSIISALIMQDGDELFARQYVQTAGPIELENMLPAYGMKLETLGGRSRLIIADGLDKEQRDLFGSLGYRKPRR